MVTLTDPVRTAAPTPTATRAPRETRAGGGGITVWRLLVFVAGIALWYLVHLLEVFPETLVPSPIDVATTLAQQLATAEYWGIIGDTLAGALVGLGFSILVGIPLGILTGRFVAVELSLRFLVDFGRSFPAVALIAVLLLILGRGIEVKAVLVFVAVVFIIILQTHHGVRSVSSSITDTAHAFRIRGGLFVRKVLLPSAAPSIMTGLRLGASVAVLITISTEVLTGSPGIGASIPEAQMGGNSALSYAYIVTAGFLGYGVNEGLGRIQARLLKWQPSQEEN